MLKYGDKVRIKDSGTIWDGSEGIVYLIKVNDKWPVFVLFPSDRNRGNGFKYSEVELVSDE